MALFFSKRLPDPMAPHHLRFLPAGFSALVVPVGFAFFMAGCNVAFNDSNPAGDGANPCGNGSIEAGEQCDSDNLAGRTCENEGFAGGTLSCRADCTLDYVGCQLGCGNGVTDPGEECDDGPANSNTRPDACRVDCLNPYCGDGVADGPETCDGSELKGQTCESLGLGTGDLGCMEDCFGFDTRPCSEAVWCGNDLREPGESCDGSDLAGQTCLTLGLLGGTLDCAPDCLDFDVTGCIQPDGGPCTDDAQCDSGTCWTESWAGYPGGYCHRECTGLADCGEGYICTDRLFCHKPCADTSECRTGYACYDWNYQSQPVCIPHCEQDADCVDTQDCNPVQGLCGYYYTGNANGEPCAEPSECASLACWPYSADGYCVSSCSLSTGLCPGDGQCSELLGGTGGDLGFCLDGCVDTTDCTRVGFDCVTNPYGSGLVCLEP